MTDPKFKRDLLSKVNAVPTGLQNLLGNVNQGVNPHYLDHKISPGVDLYPHWAANRLDIAFATAEVAGVTGQGVGITVPEGQVWQPIAMSVEYEILNLGVDDAQISCGIQKLGTGYYVPFFKYAATNIPGSAGDFSVACGGFPDRFLLSGAWQFWAQVDASQQAGVRTMTINVMYAKLSD